MTIWTTRNEKKWECWTCAFHPFLSGDPKYDSRPGTIPARMDDEWAIEHKLAGHNVKLIANALEGDND